MADPPRNLDFANVAGSRVPDGWVLSDAPILHEAATFASTDFAPEPDPNMSGWSVLGGTTSPANHPYDVSFVPLGNAVRVTENFGHGAHGVVSPTPRTLNEGQSYVFGVYLRADSAAYAGPVCQVCTDCFVGAIYDFAAGAVTHAGWLGDVEPPDHLVLAGISAEVSVVTGPGGWARVSVAFRLVDDAVSFGLSATSDYGVLLFDNALGLPEYAGAGRSADFWGFFAYEGDPELAETYASEAWVGSVYLSALATVSYATFPAAGPDTTYEGYDRWAVPYLEDLDGYLADASFAGSGATETYASGWGTDNYANENAAVVFATFGGGAETETYAVGWGTDGYIDEVPSPTEATFSADLALDAETYAPAYPEVPFDAVPATDRLNATANGLNDGVRGWVAVFGHVAGAQLPTPLSAHVRYFVVNSTANSFQISLTEGGAAVDITDAGVGECYFVPDPARYWLSE